ncbi:hypothetical protein ACJROX_17150 [Pseudalkalibacillus sp. A8]|uniref:hypothetical protein n=1 Tax=Pseudalkalibacillus sp. A8 TaxID=3382641 RepID=UPI0038B62628
MKYVTVLIVFCFTILLAYDYFPNMSQMISVPDTVFIFLIIGLFLISMLLNRNKSVDIKDALKWQVFFTSYVLILMGIFTVLGGKSAIGISFSNGVFWLVLFISLFEMFLQLKKVRNSQSLLISWDYYVYSK